MNNIPDVTKVLRPKLRRMLGLFAICVVFVATGIWMIFRAKWLGWFPLIFFGGGGLIVLGTLLPNASYLRLDHLGFTVRALYRTRFTKWCDVGPFFVDKISLNRLVVFNFASHYRGYQRSRKLSFTFTGYEACLPDSYGVALEDLASVMNQYRDYYGPRQLADL